MAKEDFHNWFSPKVDDVKEQNKKLTEYDITMNTIKHENMFKGTIIICIVYAIFGFVLVLLSYFSESARDLIFNKFLPFTLVYIIGTIIIIFIMLYYIFTFEHVKIDRRNEIDDISCPDYWDVEIIDDKYIGDSFDSNYSNDFKYKCVINSNIFDTSDMYKYHNNSNYRMTNNIANTSNALNKVGKYDPSLETQFKADYTNNQNKYNLYVDLNSYKFKSTDTSFNDAKKHLAKDLNIYNDSSRVEKIYSNLRKIAVLENNYTIDSSDNASNLLSTKNILNPKVNYSIWNKDNTVGVNVLSGTSGSNTLQVLNWNGLTNTNFDSYFNNNSNVVAIKVGIEDASTSTTYHCLGLIKQNKDDIYNVKYYFNPLVGTALNTIFPYGVQGTSAIVKSNYVDAKNLIFKTTTLFKVVKPSSIDINTYSDNTNITSLSHTYLTYTYTYEKISENGPIIQAYDKTKFRPDTMTITDLHNSSYNANGSNFIAPLLCDTVYPKLFSKLESYDIKNENNNDIRCAYSKICGIPWSDLRCPTNN